MANDYTNTGEHYLPVPAITDQFSYSRDINTLRIQINKGLAGLAAYDSNGSNYVLAAANAGAILSSVGASPRGRVIGAASGQDPTLSFQLNTGAALSTTWTLGVDDSDSDKFKIESDATIGTAAELTITSGGLVGIGTASPAQQLHVYSTATNEARIEASSGSPGQTATLRVLASGGLNFAVVAIDSAHTGAGDACKLSLQESSVEKWIIGYSSAGNWLTIRDAGDAYNAGILTLPDGGDIGIGAATGPGSGNGKVLFFGDNAGQPVMSSNTAGIYGYDQAGTVEMFAVDEAGNDTQISPHDLTTGEVIHRSSNSYSGRELLIWMERAFRALERLTGEQYVVETWRPVEKRLDWNAVQAQQAAARDAEIARWDMLDATTARGARPGPFAPKPAPAYIAEAMRVQGRGV